MKILMIDTCFNELMLLPYKYEHCLRNNIDIFIIDNMSDDGSSEYLKEKNIPHSFIDTNESFHLIQLQKELSKKIHELKPDWFIYGAGIDMFYEAQNGLRKEIEEADADGFTQIQMKLRQIPNIGEPIKKGNPFCNHTLIMQFTEYKKSDEYCKRTFISKYCESINIIPTGIYRNNINIKETGIVFEMHACKTSTERMKTLQRRQKAWNDGLNNEFGWHYRAGAEHNFIFSKERCIDISQLPEEYELYKRLQEL